MYTSIDLVVDKLTNQVVKYKKKLEKKHHRQDHIIFDEIPEDVEEEEQVVVKTKQFEMRPMDLEEAMLQMELLGHNFFLFSNAETGDANVIYKRKSWQYGLIEPKK